MAGGACSSMARTSSVNVCLSVAPAAIIHLAAVIAPAIYRVPKVARRVNVDATATLVRIAEAQPTPPRFVHASSNAVFGPRNPHRNAEPLTAADPMRPCDLYSGTKAEAEEIVHASSLDWVVLRFGGVLSTNAGGNTTVRYGNARELMLGLEVVLPDGQVWNGLRRLRKDNTGYALRHLFVVAEGTLGFITAAVMRLFPRPREAAVAFCAVRDEDAALALFRRFRDRDESAVRAFEYMSGEGVGFALKHIEGCTNPLSEPARHYVLVDLASSRPDAALRALLEGVL